MRHWYLLGTSVAALALAVSGRASADRPSAAPTSSRSAEARVPRAAAPRFVENAGQWGEGVSFAAAGKDRTLAIGPRSMTLAQHGASVEYAFDGARDVRPRGEAPTRVKHHYFHGSATARHARTFSSVVYDGAWPGVDLRFDAKPSAVEYSLVVHPGADASAARIRVSGATLVATTEDGALAVTTGADTVTHSRPVAWQEKDGVRELVAVAFDVGPRGDDGAWTYGFAIGAHDPSRAVVVDPTVEVESFPTGLQSGDQFRSIALDADGNVYAAGQSAWSGMVPAGHAGFDATLDGSFDAWLAKFDPAGDLLWATFLGGDGGNDRSNEVVVSPDGQPVLIGFTDSSDFPAAGGPLTGATYGEFLTRLAADGASLVHSGIIGSSSAHVAFAPDGAELLVFTPDNAMPLLTVTTTIGPATDELFLWLARLSATGSIDALTELRGAKAGTYRYTSAVAVDAAGAVYVTGGVNGSGALPPATVTNAYRGGYTDGFALKVNAAGTSLDYALYLGGSASDACGAIAVDAQGAAYVVGESNSSLTTFPREVSSDTDTSESSPGQGFLVKLAPSGASAEFVRAIGSSGWGAGNGLEAVYGVSFDAQGRVYASLYAGFLYRFSADGSVAESYQPRGWVFRHVIRTSRDIWAADLNGNYIFHFRDISAVTPTDLAAVAYSPRAIRVSWVPADSHETSFVVERATGNGGFEAVATTGGNATFYEDTALDPDTTYSYRVSAVTADATSPPAGPVTARTPPTIKLRVQRANVIDRSEAHGDSIALRGVAKFLPAARDATFDPATDDVRVSIEGVFAMTVPAGSPIWSPRRDGFSWTGTVGASGIAVLKVDFVRKRVSLRVTGVDLPGTPANGAEVSLHVGDEAGSQSLSWSAANRSSFGR